MDQEPERIAREIFRTRQKLGEDLDALEEKVAPRRVAARNRARLLAAASSVRDRAVAAVVSTAASTRETVTEQVAVARDLLTGEGGEPAAGSGWATVAEQTQRNPAAVAASAFAVGWFADRLLLRG